MFGDQKWELVEITVGIIFFAWDLYSLFFIQGGFKSHLKKNHPHLKCQFSPKIPNSTKSLLYKHSEKWLSPPPLPPPSPRGEEVNYGPPGTDLFIVTNWRLCVLKLLVLVKVPTLIRTCRTSLIGKFSFFHWQRKVGVAAHFSFHICQ